MNLQTKNNARLINTGLKRSVLVIMCMTAIFLLSCEEELPGEGSLPDMTPPSAAFSYSADDGDYKKLHFTNESFSASDFSWEFGDGATSSEMEPSHTYEVDGTYTVTLTAMDKLGKDSTVTQIIEIVEPDEPFQPVIMNPGFDIEGQDAYRDFWRNGDLGGVIQITSSPVHDGVRSAKFPETGDRIAYQAITVAPNTDYTLSFYYTMKSTPAGTLTVSILAGEVHDSAEIAGATLASVDLNDQSDEETYVQASLEFNSGDNTTVAIFVTNANVECRIDTFSIIGN